MDDRDRLIPVFRRIITKSTEGVGFVSCLALVIQFTRFDLNGVMSVGGATFALLFAYTSLLFNRVRATDNFKIRRRSYMAAELALRGAVYYGIAVAYFLFLYYICLKLFELTPGIGSESQHGMKYPWLLVGIVPGTFALIFSIVFVSRSLEVLVHRNFGVVSSKWMRKIFKPS